MSLSRKVLTFFGWSWAGFFGLFGLAGLFYSVGIGLGFLVWGLIFLPPLWKLTSRFGWQKNLAGRLFLLILPLFLITIGAPSSNQSARVTPSPTPAVSSQPKTASSPLPSPSLSPKAIEEKPEQAEPVSLETPSPEPSIDPSPVASIDPDAPVREAVSGSCECPYDEDSRGRSCGGRSAYSRPGGADPICYESDRK